MTSFPLQSRSNHSVFSARGAFNRLRALTLTVLGLFAIMTVCGTVASAQVETGQIAGTVLDQTGAAVPGAAVSVKNVGTNSVRNTVSSSTGGYQVTGLEPDTYEVTVTAGAFKPFTAKVEVTVGGHVTVDAKLSVSATVTEVQVIGEGGAQVNTQTQEMSQVVDTQQLAALPSLTRNPYDFVALSGNVSSGDSTTTSGAATGMSGGQSLTLRGVGFSINGQRESGTEILLDGVENIAIFSDFVGQDVPVDAVQEYSVVTNNYSAEYGRASGGVVNVTTKAGTNQHSRLRMGVQSPLRIHSQHLRERRSQLGRGPRQQTLRFAEVRPAPIPAPIPRADTRATSSATLPAVPSSRNKLFIFESTEWTRIRSAASESQEIFDPAFHRVNASEYSGLLQNLRPDHLEVCGSGDHVWGPCCGGHNGYSRYFSCERQDGSARDHPGL